MTLKRSRLKSKLPTSAKLPPSRDADSAEPGGPQRNKVTQRTATNGEPLRAQATQRTDARTRTSKRRLTRRTTPLQVLAEPIQAGVRKAFDLRLFLLVLALTAGTLLLPMPVALGAAGHRALALFVFTGSILALEPAPLPIAALMVPIARIALGIDTLLISENAVNPPTPAQQAFAPFGQPVVFLILGSLFLAEALRKHGLTRRLALYAIIGSGGRFRLLLLGLMTMTALLSMWVLNTATAAVLIPVAITIAQRVREQEVAQKALGLLVLGITYSASLGAIATIMGSGENAIASAQLAQNLPGGFGFFDWMQYGLPLVILLVPLNWALLQVAIRVPKINIDTDPARSEIERLGGFSNTEREIIGVLLLSITFWIMGDSIEGWLGLPQAVLSSAVVALGAVAILSIEEIVDWNDLKGVNWGVFFVIGAGLVLGDALTASGASAWFASQLTPLLNGLPFWVILTALVGAAFLLTQLMNNVPLGAILAPILITLGTASGIPPARLVLPTVMTIALAYTLPSGSARMTLVAVTGAIPRKEMLRAGLLVGVPSALVVWGYFFVLGWLGWI